MDMTKVYGQISGVNIKEQEALWNERGKGYYGEYLVFSEIFPLCSDKAKLLTNVQIPYNGRTTEIDVLLIDSFGIVCFEAKHYKGTIYGKSSDETWTQYFKTTNNVKFHSPILQNDYHVAALKNRFPGIPVYSIIVFANSDAVLKIENTRTDVTVCKLSGLKNEFQKESFHQKALSDENINQLFSTCEQWATKNSDAASTGKKEQLSSYDTREVVKQEKPRLSILSIILSIIGIITIVLGLRLVSSGRREKENAENLVREAEKSVEEMSIKASEMSEEVSEMQEKMDRYFSTVSGDVGGDINLKGDFVEASDVSIEESPDLNNVTLLCFTIACNGTDYQLHVNGSDELVLLLEDGRSLSGQLTEFTQQYIDRTYHGGGEYTTPVLTISGVNPEEIQYVKLISSVVKNPETYLTVVEAYEIEIYSERN